MTQENTGSVQESQSADISSNSAVNAVQTADVYQAHPVSNNERLLSQSEVNDLIGRSKHEAVERYKRSIERTNDSYNFPQNDVSADKIQQMVSEAATREIERLREASQDQMRKSNAEKVASEIISKITAAKDKYSDFEDKLNDIPVDKFADVFELANGLENTADVLYYLADNPNKLVGVNQTAASSRKLGMRELEKISKRLKENNDASKVKLPPAPLSQMRPTKNGTDSGKLTVSDYRERYKNW